VGGLSTPVSQRGGGVGGMTMTMSPGKLVNEDGFNLFTVEDVGGEGISDFFASSSENMGLF